MKHRIFIAINLPQEIKESLKTLEEGLKRANKKIGVKWVEPEKMHLTLYFLDYLEDEMISKVGECLEDVSKKFTSFELELTQIGGFPSITSPRVLFIGLKEINGGTLVSLYKDLGTDLEKIGLVIEKRPWAAHITLGRVKERKIKLSIPDSQLKVSKFKVDKLDLMESYLTSKGPIYKVIKSYRLQIKT